MYPAWSVQTTRFSDWVVIYDAVDL